MRVPEEEKRTLILGLIALALLAFGYVVLGTGRFLIGGLIMAAGAAILSQLKVPRDDNEW